MKELKRKFRKWQFHFKWRRQRQHDSFAKMVKEYESENGSLMRLEPMNYIKDQPN